MHVSELAKQSGVPAHVVRYYTQISLLTPTREPKNRYRDYANSDACRVNFIRSAKWLGFALRNVKAILGDADAGEFPCLEVRGLVKLRAHENHYRLQQFEQLPKRVCASGSSPS